MMGLRKINDGQFRISPEEWQKRQMRRHSIRQWCITILQISGMVGAVVLLILLMKWLGVK